MKKCFSAEILRAHAAFKQIGLDYLLLPPASSNTYHVRSSSLSIAADAVWQAYDRYNVEEILHAPVTDRDWLYGKASVALVRADNCSSFTGFNRESLEVRAQI